MEKFGNKQKYTLILLMSALAVYFFMRFFFAISLPFLLAFLAIWKVYPFLNKLSKKIKLRETWILGLFIFIIAFLLLGILYVPISNYFENVTFLEEDESILESELLETCVEKYNEFKEVCSEYVGEDMVENTVLCDGKEVVLSVNIANPAGQPFGFQLHMGSTGAQVRKLIRLVYKKKVTAKFQRMGSGGKEIFRTAALIMPGQRGAAADGTGGKIGGIGHAAGITARFHPLVQPAQIAEYTLHAAFQRICADVVQCGRMADFVDLNAGDAAVRVRRAQQNAQTATAGA